MIKVSNLKSYTRGIDITMDSINHNTSLRTNKHLSYEERFFIEKQLQVGVSKTAIANALGRSRTTIQSEIQRGSVEQIKAGKRVLMYLADYGIAQIQNNKRYVLDNPFGNDRFMDCDTKSEIFYNNRWFEPKWDGNAGYGSVAYGVSSGSLLEGIVIQTGSTGIKENSYVTGSLDGSGAGTLTSAPARVIVQFNGKTRRTR